MKILTLVDNRISNQRSVDAISASLESDASNIHQVKFETNFLAILPNIFLIFFPRLFFTKIISGSIPKDFDIIISSGRRLATIAMKLKKKHNAKFIQILDPSLPFFIRNKINVIVLPLHDQKYDTDDNNIVNICGSIVNIDMEEAAKIALKCKDILDMLHRPFITVLIGGNCHGQKVKMSAMIDIVNKLNTIAQSLDGTLLISTSRRTPKEFVKVLGDNIECSAYLNVYNPKSKTINPYLAFLIESDFVIVTDDSISMISDAIFANKSTYVLPTDFSKDKHKRFVKDISSKKIIKLINSGTKKLQKYKVPQLNNFDKISSRIMHKLNIS